MCHPNSSHDASSILRDTVAVSKTGPTITEGYPNAQGSKVKPGRWVRAARATRARDEVIQGVTVASTFWGPIEGTQCPQALYLIPDREVSFMPLHVGWHLAI
jgi:hypothetical protein